MDAVPPSDADRATAVEDVKQLLSAGTITSQEFADRSRTIAQARSLAELTAAARPPVTGSLGSVPTGAARTPAEPLLSSVARTLTGRPFVGLLARTAGGAAVRRLVLLGLSFAIVGGGIAYAASVLGGVRDVVDDIRGDGTVATGTDSGTTPGDSADVPRRPRLLTTGGLERLRDAIEAEHGSTRYLSAVVYPTYASVELPISGRTDLSRRVFYDGRLADGATDTPRRADARSADLRDVDADALVRAVRRAPRQLGVDRVSSTYVVLDTREGRHVMSVYVSDGAGRSGYWTMRLDGTTVRTYRAS